MISVIINCAVTCNIHVNFIMKSQRFHLSLYFWSVGETELFVLGRVSLSLLHGGVIVVD